MFRSITFKLTLAFLLVGLAGTILVTFFVSNRTEAEFDRFVLDQGQSALVEGLVNYYTINDNSWQGVDRVFNRRNNATNQFLQQKTNDEDGPLRPQVRNLSTLIDLNGTVIASGRNEWVGLQFSADRLEQAVAILVNEQPIGYILFDAPLRTAEPRLNSEEIFRQNVRRAWILGVLGAALIALVLGVLLARTLTKPILALQSGTTKIAAGELGHQVEVTGNDELGDLTRSFNAMSQDLADASHLRRQMTADIAHDLRTPLSVILGYTEALSDGKLRGSAEMYDVMHQEARHLSRLIDDLRTLSLADAGELGLHLQSVAPTDLLNRIVATYRNQAVEAQVDLQVAVDQTLTQLTVDPERMTQVMNNLVSNALRYTPAHGKITLSANQTINAVRLSVQDTGSGIPPDELPHIFERFYRVDKSRNTESGESGLGLAIARSLVHAHGGQLAVKSTVGQGTTFTIYLPKP